MSSLFTFQRAVATLTLTLAMALTGLAMGGGLMGLAAADDTDATNDSADIETIAIDEDTRIVEWDVGNGHGEVTIESDRRQPILLSDALAGVEHEGATRVPEQETELAPGTNELSMNLESINGDSVMTVSTVGGTIRLSTGMTADDDPFQAFGGASGLLFGIVMTVGLSALGAVYVLKSEQTGVEKA